MLSGHRYVVITALALWGCGNMQFPSIDTAGFLPVSSETQQSVETTESVHTEEEINGRPIDEEDEDRPKKRRRASRADRDDRDDRDEDRPRRRRSRDRDRDRDEDDDRDDERPVRRVSQPEPVAKLGFGATCKTNNDCESRACFVGSGELGYCTKMCDSWSDCPSFWECKKPGNAPQRICMQDEDD